MVHLLSCKIRYNKIEKKQIEKSCFLAGEWLRPDCPNRERQDLQDIQDKKLRASFIVGVMIQTLDV